MSTKPTLVVALGGNALLKRGQPLEADLQQKNIELAAQQLAVLSQDWRIVLVHGNGPQVGLLALQNEAYQDTKPYPLDILVAETQGMIGYLLQQALRNYLPNSSAVCVITQVLTDSNDPAYHSPNKYIGPSYRREQLSQLDPSWQIKPDGDTFRRVVASPRPQKILETSVIGHLLEDDHLVICCGGGGVPVIEQGNQLQGTPAVVDKDLAAALLAEELDADALLILTDAKAVYLDWNTPQQSAISNITCQELNTITFDQGSMGPKVKACCAFVEKTQGIAAIGALDDALDILNGKQGTRIYPSHSS
ncbi:carbamate kinase [Rosenbergiella epipactidis]|uniref:carbamate kinase n=1 Tax=Rosenbergiella epipactidis TaxID=1544694 RepID=UPI001BDAFD29|nr:carbamate kinase [Rosenbergiella epipactidis]MBT0717589.1 carbamate kinase [Rosenbergiella epipactidis]